MTPDQLNAFWGSVFGNFVADGLLLGVPLLIGLLIRSVRKQQVLEKFWKNKKSSPDGLQATAEVDGDIYLGSQDNIKNLTHTHAREENAIWSDDSRLLAFQRRYKLGWEVWVTDTETKKSALITPVVGDKRREITWLSNNDLVIQMGGSYWTVYNQEIEKRLR